MEFDVCPICNSIIVETEGSCRLTAKGITSLLETNKGRGDHPISCLINQKIHTDCRLNYCHKREIKKYLENKSKGYQPSSTTVHPQRSIDTSFAFKTDCLFFVVLPLLSSKKEKLLLTVLR